MCNKGNKNLETIKDDCQPTTSTDTMEVKQGWTCLGEKMGLERLIIIQSKSQMVIISIVNFVQPQAT